MANDEWITPLHILDMAREIMGTIELDPATSMQGNVFVAAERFYTKKDDGLGQDWQCNTMWMNPPFSCGSKFVRKFLSERGNIGEAMVLMNAGVGTKWFRQMIDAIGFCYFTTGRTAFVNPETMVDVRRNRESQVFFYHGPKPAKFIEVLNSNDTGFPLHRLL